MTTVARVGALTGLLLALLASLGALVVQAERIETGPRGRRGR